MTIYNRENDTMHGYAKYFEMKNGLPYRWYSESHVSSIIIVPVAAYVYNMTTQYNVALQNTV